MSVNQGAPRREMLDPFFPKTPARIYTSKKTARQGVDLPSLRENPPARLDRDTEIVFPDQPCASVNRLFHAEEADALQKVDDWLTNEAGSCLPEASHNDELLEFSHQTGNTMYSSDDDVESQEHDLARITPPYSLTSLERKQQSKSPPYRAKSLKRRPHLIIRQAKDYPPRGYKKLTPKPGTGKSGVSRARRLDDGFADHETKVSGMVPLGNKRKAAPPIDQTFGVLEVTQSERTIQMRPTRKRVRRVEDNSFDIPKGGTRLSRPRKPDDGKGEQQAASKADDTEPAKRPDAAGLEPAVGSEGITKIPALEIISEESQEPTAPAKSTTHFLTNRVLNTMSEKAQASTAPARIPASDSARNMVLGSGSTKKPASTAPGRITINGNLTYRDVEAHDSETNAYDDVAPGTIQIPSTQPSSGQRTLIASPGSTNETVISETSPCRSRGSSEPPMPAVSPSVLRRVVDAGVQTTQRVFQRAVTM